MQPWIRIRQQLYRQLETHVRQILGSESLGLSRYREEYEKEFRKGWKPSKRDVLLHEVMRSSLVLMGDFHALQQSQKAQLRVLKGIPASKSLILGLECFEAAHQKEIDRYMSGEISEKDFLKLIQWQKNWGFPWEHYRPLIRWAQKRKVRIFGLNKRSQGRSAATLVQRDRFAAEVIQKIRQQNPEHLLFVAFGDLHVARKHLPEQIQKKIGKKPERILSVFQNSERLYFQLLEKGLELDVDVVRLAKDQFCLLNVPPWVKWQNYLLFLENNLDHEIDEGSEFTDEVESYLKILAHDLGVQAPSGSFSVHTPADEGFWDQLKQFSDRDRKWIQGWIETGTSFFVPEISVGFLARPTVNHAAGLAMAILHAHISERKKTLTKMPDDFLRLVWSETIQYFGTKLINPKRKTDTFQDIKVSLAAQSPSDQGKEALQLALSQKMNELLWHSGVRKKREMQKPRRQASYQQAARLLGGMLGEKLFMAHRKRVFSQATILGLLRRPIEASTFDHFYYEVLELIEGLPEPFLSKTEKL